MCKNWHELSWAMNVWDTYEINKTMQQSIVVLALQYSTETFLTTILGYLIWHKSCKRTKLQHFPAFQSSGNLKLFPTIYVLCPQGGRWEGPLTVCSSLGVDDSLHPHPGPLLLPANPLHDTGPLPHGPAARWDRRLLNRACMRWIAPWDYCKVCEVICNPRKVLLFSDLEKWPYALFSIIQKSAVLRNTIQADSKECAVCLFFSD